MINPKKHPMYGRWRSMKTRCYNPNASDYKHWGGRGIYVCERWLNSFEDYVNDLGPAPSPKHTVDRINNDGPYCPENCRWATSEQQNSNMQTNVWLEIGGKRKTITQWSRYAGISEGTLRKRIARGCPTEELVKKTRFNHRIEFNGLALTVKEWEVKTGRCKNSITKLLKRGWSVKKVLTTPVELRFRHKKKALVKISACGA